jgi:FkbM family methyltransferase
VSLSRALFNSHEYAAKNGGLQSPFWHYHTSFDPQSLIAKFARHDIKASPDHVTNFLGVKVRPNFFPTLLSAQAGKVEPPPLPANWHADIAEWGSCLRAVDLSGDRFVMLELGCGWGCWMNNLGVAARSAGKRIRLYGIEADAGHLEYARQALNDNDISADEFVLVNGIAGKSANVALFPKVQSGIDWGGSAIINPTTDQLESATRSGKFIHIPIVDISDLLKDEPQVDLVHVDIQGAELDLLREVFNLLCEKVRYIFIGTHSKQIEAGLFEMFLTDGRWRLEMERAAIFRIEDGKPIVIGDGVQAWRNTRFG